MTNNVQKIYETSKLIQYEHEMLQHVPFDDLISYRLTPTTPDIPNRIELTYSIDPFWISIEDMLKHSTFNNKLLRQLLKSILNLEGILELHMLTKSHMNYDLKCIYYCKQSERFKWIYEPFERVDKTPHELHLIRHLIIEQAEQYIHMDLILPLLSEKRYSKSELLIKLDKNQPKKAVTFEPIGIKKILNLLVSNHKQNSGESKGLKTTPSVKNAPKHDHESLENNLLKTTCIKRYPTLMVRDRPHIQFPLYYEVNIIGRHESCDVFIDENEISRAHAKIIKSENVFYIEDLKSSNGTFLNDKIINSLCVMKSGDEIRLGSTEFLFII